MPDPEVQFLEDTLRVWQPRTARKLSQEDAREITRNVVGFFRTLKDFASRERKQPEGALAHPEAGSRKEGHP